VRRWQWAKDEVEEERKREDLGAKNEIRAQKAAVRQGLLALLQSVEPTVPRHDIERKMDDLYAMYPGDEAAMFVSVREEYADRLVKMRMYLAY
jgi:hypothetical protein